MQWMQVQAAVCGRGRNESERQGGALPSAGHWRGVRSLHVLVTIPGERCVASATQKWSLGLAAMIESRKVRE